MLTMKPYRCYADAILKWRVGLYRKASTVDVRM